MLNVATKSIMLGVMMPSVISLNAIMLSVISLSVIMLSVISLSVIPLSVMAPFNCEKVIKIKNKNY
jgi:hypothetical protein